VRDPEREGSEWEAQRQKSSNSIDHQHCSQSSISLSSSSSIAHQQRTSRITLRRASKPRLFSLINRAKLESNTSSKSIKMTGGKSGGKASGSKNAQS